MRDDYGNEIKPGDKVRFVVGIPGREVMATVRHDYRGRLVVDDGTSTMALKFVLRFFDTKVVH